MNKKIAFFSTTFFPLILLSSAIATEISHDTKKTYVSIEKIASMCSIVYQKIQNDKFAPELIIGISRGGLIPLGFLAGEQMFNNRTTRIISIRSYDDEGTQKKLNLIFPIHTEELKKFKSILVVDDIADSGKTLDYVITVLKNDLPTSTIKTATLFYKKRSVIQPDYYVEETRDWVVFPWE